MMDLMLFKSWNPESFYIKHAKIWICFRLSEFKMAAGKVCLVLGAGEKLGFAVARKYAQSGFKGIVKPIQLIKGRRHFYINLLVYDVVKFSKSFLST